MQRFIPYILLFCTLSISHAQGIQDSVFHISQVQVSAEAIFKKEEAGQKITHVDSVILMEKINMNLSEILTENTSLLVKNYGRGALATASFRGASATHTQVSWNGININSPMLGMVDFSLIPAYLIDDLSLEYGAASVSKQSGGIGGHISIDNKVNWTNTFSGRYYQGFGSFNTFDQFGQINLGSNKFQSKSRVYYNYSKNDYSFTNKHIININPDTGTPENPLQKNNNAEYSKYGVSQEFYLRPTDRFVISSKVWYQGALRSIPTVMSYEGPDTLNRTNQQNDHALRANIELKHYTSKLMTQFRSGIDYQELDYVMSVDVSGLGEVKPVNSSSDMLSWYNQFNTNYTLSRAVKLELKADINHFNISTFDSVKLTGYAEVRNEASVYGATNVSLLSKVNVSLGLRKDWIPEATTPLIYNLGISIKPFPKAGLEIKLSAARNYHHPSLNDLYWQPGGDPDLLPEKGTSLESGVKYVGTWENISLETEVTAYNSRISNWILWLPSARGYWEPLNIKEVQLYGIETSVKITGHLSEYTYKLHSNYAFTKTLNHGDPLVNGDKSTGMQLPFIPVHSANLFGSIGYKYYFIRYQYSFQGITNLLSSNQEGIVDDSGYFGAAAPESPFYRLYPQHLNHITLGRIWVLNKVRIGTELKVHNFLNEEYRNILNRFMPRRHYSLNVKIDF